MLLPSEVPSLTYLPTYNPISDPCSLPSDDPNPISDPCLIYPNSSTPSTTLDLTLTSYIPTCVRLFYNASGMLFSHSHIFQCHIGKSQASPTITLNIIEKFTNSIPSRYTLLHQPTDDLGHL